MGGRGIAEESVENNCVVFFLRFVDVETSVANGDVAGGSVEVEVFLGDGNDGGIDFDDVSLDALFGERAGNNADAAADAEDVFERGLVAPREFVEHVGEEGKARFGFGVVGVLDEEIVEVIAASAGFEFEDLDLAEVGVAHEEAVHAVEFGIPFCIEGRAAKKRGAANEAEEDQGCFGAIPNDEIKGGESEEDAGGGIHGGRIGEHGQQYVTDQDGSEDAAQGADGGEATDLAADAFDRLGQHAHQEWAGGGEQCEWNQKQEEGGKKRAESEIVIEKCVSDFLGGEDGDRQIKSGGGDAFEEAFESHRAIDEPAAEVISERERNERDGDLGGPDEVRRADVGRKHFGAEDFNDQDRGAVDGGG